MCNQVPSVTLQTAVLMQVKEFAQNNQPFSVHDITRSIRSKTSQGELEVPEVEVSGASFRFDIPHAKVKALFDELWRTGVFDPDFTLSRQFNGMYFEYTPASVGSYAGVSVNPQPVSTAPTPPPVATPPTVGPSGILNDNAVVGRIQKYLTNCASRNFRPTLKQVQSAIKRGDASTGWSCDDLKEAVVKFGYSVVDNPDNISKAQVVTV